MDKLFEIMMKKLREEGNPEKVFDKAKLEEWALRNGFEKTEKKMSKGQEETQRKWPYCKDSTWYPMGA